jgi:catechol 2,3-dioxygenase-like lactoylglutathione lyase family enzyme
MNAVADAARSVEKSSPMFIVSDMEATVRWYTAIGFTLEDSYEDAGELIFARVSLGKGELTLSPGASIGPQNVRLWFLTNRVDDLYRLFKGMRHTDGAVSSEVQFEEELYEPFYGGRQFSIRDLNGMPLIFWQPARLRPTG